MNPCPAHPEGKGNGTIGGTKVPLGRITKPPIATAVRGGMDRRRMDRNRHEQLGRRNVYQGPFKPRPRKEFKPGSLHPFKRISVLSAAAQAAQAKLNLANTIANNPPRDADLVSVHAEQITSKEAYDAAMAEFFAYRSRSAPSAPWGKRKGMSRSCTSRTLQDRSIYTPWRCAQKHEIARRLRQLRHALNPALVGGPA